SCVSETGPPSICSRCPAPISRWRGLHAAKLVKRLLDGRGGGSAEVAQGGGTSADRLAETLGALPGLVTATG
ncbi:hypothetical protein, partial [Streptomyces bacillaris]|uniref:hypothetical protein n=1 Tax=Streptomyces bacillaris TaxID=68179 RepID=UPI00367F9EC3